MSDTDMASVKKPRQPKASTKRGDDKHGREARFEFIVGTGSQLSQGDRKFVRSHASRGKAIRKEPGFKSWILQQKGRLTEQGQAYIRIPSSIGSDLDHLSLPEPLKPYMRRDLNLAITRLKDALYPPEICLQVDPQQSTWSAFLLTDEIYFHSSLFSVEAYIDMSLSRNQSALTQYHLLKTLRLLQDRLGAWENADDAISDPTIMTVTTLGLSAELSGDRVAARNHMSGLYRMVALRGGLDQLRFENSRLPAKVCRVDLSLALRFGDPPVFFHRSAISWDQYIAGQGLIRGAKDVPQGVKGVCVFMESLDSLLYNVFRDLQEFCRISKLAYQTTHKLRPNTFSEAMISVLYRLVNLSFPGTPTEEAVRLGMVVFASSVFFQWRGLGQRQEHIHLVFENALAALRQSASQPPVSLQLWLLMMWNIYVANERNVQELTAWTRDVFHDLKLASWCEVREVLRTVLWVDFVHEEPGKGICEHVAGIPADV